MTTDLHIRYVKNNYRCLIHLDRLSITFRHCTGSAFQDIRNPDNIPAEQAFKNVSLIHDKKPGPGAFYHTFRVYYKGLIEKEILESFWRVAKAVDQFVTFNGRNFDVPFIMMRSAMVGVKVTKNLMGYRYGDEHIDLLEQFTFYGSTRKFNLDFYCQSFGIESPKSKDISGMEVKNLFEAGRIKDIAVYCSKDIYATYQLYKIWEKYLAHP